MHRRFHKGSETLALIAASSITEELRLGTVRILPISTLQTHAPIMVVYRRQAYLTRAVRLLLAMLTAQDNVI
ncbi:hypothetical protein KSC_009110 [Ktedonobacter sp. SOSP1-52]|uniref:LysR substrate-binding domain-containing protein n=1 Tax=Ktedonobacter sp. SOSP1-52 TaxID=2778366 RepID=UPI001A262670|nr:LysR substrate-binding domain-containing protein [Ktedonobacter sp. SOSP1-52]GHO62019.1 hypothetical protein KSC_009110 [Ktedonobacter sp. SOSP1-52]